jgi:DNA-directed RNA polymerase specialized sigma24 family protein
MADRGRGVPTEAGSDARLRDRAVAGDAQATRQLIGQLVPVIQARVARCLAQNDARRNLKEEVRDLTQDVLASLFENGGRLLRAWDPERGLSLANFVGLVARRQALSLLRTRRRSPWAEDPVGDLGPLLPDGDGPEAQVASREVLEKLLAGLEAELSPLGLELFELLVVQQLEVDEVIARTRMSRDAVYAWRSRLGKLIRQRAAALGEAGHG